MKRLRVVHLAPGHVALDTRVFHKEARTLAAHGYDVVVVARHQVDEEADGIEIIALPNWSNRMDRFTRGQMRLVSRAWKAAGDIYHLHDFDAIPVGLLMRLRGKQVIYDSHEDYPRLVRSRTWIPGILKPVVVRLVRAVEWMAAHAASAVISAEEEGATRFPAGKTAIVRNYVLDEELAALDPRGADRRGCRVIYVGAMSRERGIVDAVKALPKAVDGRVVELVLLGRLGDLETELERLPQWSQVIAPGFASREEVHHHLLRADVGLLLLHDTPKYAEGAVPVKLFEYMAAGLPIIASDLPTTRDLFEKAHCGVLVDPREPELISRTVVQLLGQPRVAQEMGMRGRTAVAARYLWSSQAPALVAVYDKLGRGAAP